MVHLPCILYSCHAYSYTYVSDILFVAIFPLRSLLKYTDHLLKYAALVCIFLLVLRPWLLGFGGSGPGPGRSHRSPGAKGEVRVGKYIPRPRTLIDGQCTLVESAKERLPRIICQTRTCMNMHDMSIKCTVDAP